jgi:hypothetical protein
VPSSVGSSAGAASIAASGIASSSSGGNAIDGFAQLLLNAADTTLRGTGGQGSAPYITVNMGVVGDPEAAARVIVDTVNNSSYRGTGGANNFVLVS